MGLLQGTRTRSGKGGLGRRGLFVSENVDGGYVVWMGPSVVCLMMLDISHIWGCVSVYVCVNV